MSAVAGYIIFQTSSWLGKTADYDVYFANSWQEAVKLYQLSHKSIPFYGCFFYRLDEHSKDIRRICDHIGCSRKEAKRLVAFYEIAKYRYQKGE